MLSLKTPIEKVLGIGPKYKRLLEQLEITDVESLLYHFPFRYDDFSKIKQVSDLQLGEIATVKGILGPVTNIFTRNGKRITRAKVADHTGEINLIWFNQHFLKKTLQVGQAYNVSGKVASFDSKPAYISPEMELEKSTNINTGRLVPIYPETYGVSSKWLRTRINDIINNLEQVEEFLPLQVLEKNKFNNLAKSIKMIHFPESENEISKSRERFAFEELFLELLKVEKRKLEWAQQQSGHSLKPFERNIKDFIEKLPFKLTDSQQTAVKEILNDLYVDTPMNRLLEGDVGTGKTVVAMIAAYLMALNKLRVIYMAPTEILAKQHFSNFYALFSKLGIKVELLTSGKNVSDKNWDILIGTHAVLFNKEDYENVGLIVIDEQHRFGVEQRGKIMEMSKKNRMPHLLTMTATPIPRTLALTLYGDLSISILETHPHTERKIYTKVVPSKNREEAYQWIKEKNEPTFIVCPLIETSEIESLSNVKAAETEFKNLQETFFKNTQVGLIHGRLKSQEKQEVMDAFKNGKIRVLVATPVIEVGIDIPEASIMVIESSERYGLASLHQLRGRVGRGDKPGYCFIFMSEDSHGSYSRLKYLENINSGIKLAEIDLKLRGEGDIFSSMQHGFKRFKIASLGDIELLEKVKKEAQIIYPEIDRYPALQSKLGSIAGPYVKNN